MRLKAGIQAGTCKSLTSAFGSWADKTRAYRRFRKDLLSAQFFQVRRPLAVPNMSLV
jgi:hypothetical protein